MADPPPLTQEQKDRLLQGMRSGDMVYMSMAQGMLNHGQCYGLMTKKTPDGSRVLRYTTNAKTLLEDEKVDVPGPQEHILLHHDPGTFNDVFCEFDHGIHELRVESDVNDLGGPVYKSKDGFHARLNLAQLRDMADECALCSILTQGIDRWRWVWQPQMDKYRYCDSVWRNKDKLPDGDYMKLFTGADNGQYDERFLPGPLQDVEVALYVDFSRSKQTLRINVQKYPLPELQTRRMVGLADLEVIIDIGGHTPWAAIKPRPVVSRDVLSESSLKKLHGWIDDCVQNHDLCQQPDAATAESPTRLIEIKSTITGELSVHLLETDPNNSYKYIALSHSWAASRPLKTDKHNYSEHKDEIPWNNLSRVYQDTFALANALSINYVWIDSLCIIQQDAEEWNREAHRMGNVYSNAFLVFVALGDELALEKDPMETFTIFGYEKATGDELYKSTDVHIRRKVDHDNLINSANAETTGQWFSRGWCFQERLFATRLLHFGGGLEDITFECNTHLQCECGGVRRSNVTDPESNDEKKNLSSLWCHAKAQFAREFNDIVSVSPDEQDEDRTKQVRDDLLTMYIALCEDFSSKRFSFSDDTLPAMDSLASKLGPYLGDYHAGLWAHNILISLQWESFDATHSRRYTPCCAPSFSWASCTGGAIWYMNVKELLADVDNREFAEVVEVFTIPADPAIPYGKVIFSGINLHGLIRPSWIEPQKPDRVGRMYLEEIRDEQWVQLDTEDDIEDVQLSRDGDLDVNGDPLKPVLCFELMRSVATSGRGTKCFVSALILVPHEQDMGTLRRIGFAILNAEWFDQTTQWATVSLR